MRTRKKKTLMNQENDNFFGNLCWERIKIRCLVKENLKTTISNLVFSPLVKLREKSHADTIKIHGSSVKYHCIFTITKIAYRCPDDEKDYIAIQYREEDYTGEYTFFSYIPGVMTVERFLHWWHVASRVSR
jgi:hypothetical protein